MYSEDQADILTRMRGNVPSDVDTSEGSFVNDALAPVSSEIAEQEMNLDQILLQAFATTAAANGYSDALENRCAEFGLSRKPGTAATVSLQFTGADGTYSSVTVQTDAGLQYTAASVTVSSGTGTATGVAADIGAAYDVPAGAIDSFPVAVSGLTTVTNTAPAAGGTDEESDAALLARLLAQVQVPSTSGNAANYRQWALEVDGIGAAQVFPLWNGPGTVKVCAVDSNMQPLSDTLLSELSAYIETQRPIGAAVTYESATALPISISVTVTRNTAYLVSQIQNGIEGAVTAYLKSIATKQGYVSYAMIGSLIMTVTGVTDYSGLTVNGGTSNITVSGEQVATLGTVAINAA